MKQSIVNEVGDGAVMAGYVAPKKIPNHAPPIQIKNTVNIIIKTFEHISSLGKHGFSFSNFA
jgi:hypothetical protein